MSDRTKPTRPDVDLAKLPGVSPASTIPTLLRLKDIGRILAVSPKTVERLKASGRLPKPDADVGFGARRSPRWRPETIDRWIEIEGGGRCR